MTQKQPMDEVRYPRGSEWRRWDPHVHTPASALQNDYGTWDQYIAALESADPAVAAIGVTDYCSIAGYKKVLEYRSKNRLQNFDLIFPNIEFRISPELPGGGGIDLPLRISSRRN